MAAGTMEGVRVISQTDLERAIEADSNIVLDDMPDKSSEVDELELPAVEREKREFLIGDRGNNKIFRPRNIQDINGKRFRYGWISQADRKRPDYAGWRMVIKGKEGSFGPRDGGMKILDEYFNTQGIIQRGDLILHFCKLTFAESNREKYRKIARQRLENYKPGKAQSIKTEGGMVNPGDANGELTTTTFDTNLDIITPKEKK